MKLILAPMEGVVDALMRQLLTEIGGYDLCVTEFVRVTEQKLPKKVFYRLSPELQSGGKTPSGVPVRVQLLGQSPEWLAENAKTAIDLGSPGIDLNFGCPAKTVNKSNGGAILLKDPELIYRIVRAVREAIPAEQILSAKIRLGYEDKSLALENASAIENAGANELTVHARTKVEGYKPPAHWHWIETIRQSLSIPVIANGELWTCEHLSQCRMETETDSFMLGRGALARPNLAQMMRQNQQQMTWNEILAMLLRYTELEVRGDKMIYFPNRIKQWLSYLRLAYSEADELFRELRSLRQTPQIVTLLHEKTKAL